MRNEKNHRPGFLLIEVMLGIVLFSLFAGALALSFLSGQEATLGSGDRARAVALAEEALEAARAMRDVSFSSLTAGQHGVRIGSNGKWELSGTGSSATVGFVTSLTMTPIAVDHVSLTARTDWKRSLRQSGSVVLQAELTDWRKTGSVGNWSSIALEGNYVDAGTPLFNAVAVSGNYAFLTSEISSGGKGLYVFDISNTTSPVRVATSFDLGVDGYGVAVQGSVLYVATGDTSQEIRAYHIAQPSTFSSSQLLSSYNLPGSARARSLAVGGTSLFVGANESVTSGEHELHSFAVTTSGALTFSSSIDVTGGVASLALSGTSAFLATSNNTSELATAKVSPATSISLPAGQGYNLTDVQDALSVAVSGTAAVLGRQMGSAIDEFVLFDLEGGGGFPVPPPGPWYREIGGAANGVDLDTLHCYAFVASDFSSKELQVINLRNSSLPEASYYDAANAGRTVRYDAQRDRLYLLTNTSFLILKPAASPVCT